MTCLLKIKKKNKTQRLGMLRTSKKNRDEPKLQMFMCALPQLDNMMVEFPRKSL